MNLEDQRKLLLEVDGKLIELLNERAKISKEISVLKHYSNLEIRQDEFWELASLARNEQVKDTILNIDITNKIFELIQKQSILIQQNVVNILKNDDE
jgi:chorismate mutase